MRRSVRTLALALVIVLAVGVAQAASIGAPQFSTSPFTKAQTGAGNAVTMTLTWLPPAFVNPSPNDHQEIVVADLAGGAPTTFSAGPTAATAPLLLSDGHQYSITVGACQIQSCGLGSPSTTQTTRIDATPPAGTVQINGGAAATNNPAVTLNLTAADPLIGGVPGTSSGVTQEATDIDGDGTFPCSFFSNGDSSGCAVAFAPTIPATLTAGDGVKTLGVKFGDGARANTAPCARPPFCAVLLGSFIEGNASAETLDTILLDTVKPTAVATLDRTTVERGGSVGFTSASSLDTSPTAPPSGIDPAATTWDFKDGSPVVTGASASHVFNQVGTFVGQLRVKDRAGNVSDPRTFSVTVTSKPGDAITGGSTAGVSGTAGFSISRLKVTARYVKSRLKGSIAIDGTSTLAGGLRAEVRKTARGKVLRKLSTTVAVAPFARTLKLPATLLPGTYRLAFIGPGGTLTTTLTLTAPKEGVISAGRVKLSGHGNATAKFTFAARPVAALRTHLAVKWTQGARALGVVDVGTGATVSAGLPAGATLGKGRLRAVLLAGSTVVGSAQVRVR